jgi:aldose 1-epimerase
MKPGIEKDVFGTTSDGKPVERYVLRNANGLAVGLITYGATVTELLVPDRQGAFADVVLGFNNLAQYETESPYFGCVAGRVAFRIAEGRFTLDGKSYQLTLNNGRHHLHGGVRGLSKVVWEARPLETAQGKAVEFTHTSPDGDQGYPGNLQVAVIYELTDDDELLIQYSATTDQPTPVNLTHHSYFNLAGAGSGDILGHVLHIDADRYTPTDKELTPTGEFASAIGTPFDFTTPTAIGARIEQVGGYDLSYLLNHQAGSLARVATACEPTSGRSMEVLATAPAVILYTGHYLDGTLQGKDGKVYPKFAGLCLETGHLPDSVHHPKFPSVILRPGETYRQTCVYRFRPTFMEIHDGSENATEKKQQIPSG